MDYEKLSLNGLIREMKDVSSGSYPRKFCFVLGAGASRSSGIKTGQELVDIWEKELSERNREKHDRWKAGKKITEKNRYSFYSEYYEERYGRHPRDGYNFLEKLMENARPSAGYVMLAYLLSSTPHNVVITTNFDHLAEDALTYYTRTVPRVIGHEDLAHWISAQDTRPVIVKLHRDLLFGPRNTTGELEELHKNWKGALDILFRSYNPVFIGYAGNDKSFMTYLIENSDKFKNNTWCFPYWMLYKNEELNEKSLEFLQKSGGYCIRHNGFDETLYMMGAEFDYRIPTEEDFLSDAKNRYRNLSTAIDKFTEKLSELNEPVSGEEDGQTDGMNLTQAIRQITDQTEEQSMYRQAVELYANGEYDEALTISIKLTELQPENARYHNSLGVTLHEMGRYNEALKEKQKAVELEPENAEFHDSLGFTLHELEKFDEALTEKQMAVELEPENARHHNSLGNTFQKMGRYGKALTERQKAVELEPQNALYRNDLSVTLHSLNKYDEALTEAKRAVELEPDTAIYHYNLSVTLYMCGRYDESFTEIQKAVELEPNNAMYHYELGLTFQEYGEYDEALAEIQKTVELEPNNAMYHYELSLLLHKMDRYNEALTAAQSAVKLKPKDAEYHDSLGSIMHDMKKYYDAYGEKQRAVEIDPDNAMYHESFGTTLLALGDHDRALIEKQRAVQLDPDNAIYHDSLGTTLLILGKENEALTEVRKAVELEPGNTGYHNRLDFVLQKLKNKTQ